MYKIAQRNLVILVLLFVSITFFANLSTSQTRHWRSGSRIIAPGGEITLQSSRMVGSVRVFDIVISLYNDPAGDNDPLTTDDRTPYENILRFFADAVYEATEGAHKIGTVSIYTKGRFADRADIRWGHSGWPKESFLSNKILMYDIFDSKLFTTSDDRNYLEGIFNEEGGYTLAHEWGHHTLGLMDEYKGDDSLTPYPYNPRKSDMAVRPSLMNEPRMARGGQYQWLNLSIAFPSTGGEDSRNTGQNAQDRWYGDPVSHSGGSAWETLVRNPKDDLKHMVSFMIPKRTYFPELATVAPTGQPENQLLLPDASPRSELRVLWMSERIVFQIVLDKSGSMAGEKLANAKEAAKNLVNVSEYGKTSIGIIAFNSTPSILAPITEINAADDKSSLNNIIDSISASDGTAVYDAAMVALSGISSQEEEDGRAVFLLTDGIDGGSSATPDTVISNYLNEKIPLYTFSYGTDANVSVLSRLAADTNGKFYSSPTTLAAINQAFNDAKQSIAAAVSISSGVGSRSLYPYAQFTEHFPVDSTVGRLTLSITFDAKAEDLAISLLDPATGIITPSWFSTSGNETTCYFSIDAPLTGNWELTCASLTSSRIILVTTSIDASSNNQATYSLVAESMHGVSLQYPTPILLRASLGKELPIKGANVTGTVFFPDGTPQSVDFRDDGVVPDFIAGDGTYSAILEEYPTDGVYTINIVANNSGVSAYLTENGMLPSLGPDGTVPDPRPDIPITESFARTQFFQINIQGVVADDHGNDCLNATPISSDNSDNHGRIENTADIDFFSISVPEPVPSGIVFRITNLSSGMIPVLTIYDEQHTQIAQREYVPGEEHLSIYVSPNGNAVLFASVHITGASIIGNYDISAGLQIGSDNVNKPPTVASIEATSITSTSAMSGGNVTADGGSDVTVRGVCWNTVGSPIVTDSHTSDGSGVGSFTSSLNGLSPNTDYHIRAYATNSMGTGYGDELQFTTSTSVSPFLPAHKVVYSSDETGDGEIFVVYLDSDLNVISKVNVTNRTSGEGYPRWSPTGDRIAFQSDYDGTGQTWVMNADGSNKRRVTNESLPVAPISWSTDGLSIYALMASPGDGEVVQVNVETGAVTVMTDVAGYNTQHWDLNSDQTKIAYVRGVEGNGFSNQLYVADFAVSGSDFTNIVLLPDAVPAPHSPRFSPSGTRIAVHLDRISPLGEGIGIIGTDGSNFLTPIPVEGFVNQTPEWIDENRIIYAHGTNPSANLYVLNLNDMSQKQITDANGYQGFPDVYSYSQVLPAFKTVYSSDETGDGEIFVVYLDSDLNVISKVNVTNRTSGEGYPRWSPTGDRIAFQSDYDGTGQTWVMNADGSNKRRVTNESLPVAPISWSTDGLSIYALMASPGDGEVVQVNVETGAVTVMTDVAGYNTQHWDLNSDQTKIAYVRGVEGNGFSNQLYVADFAVSGSDFTNTVLLPDAVPAPHSPRFSPSGTRIAVHLDRISPLGEGIGIIGTDGSNFLTPIPVEGFVNQTPEWIDENRIIYAHGTNPSANLYVLNLNDMSQKQITDANGYQGFPDVFLVPQPDLAVESLTLSPISPTTADDIVFTAVVRNQGGVAAAASVLQIRVGGETDGTSYPVPALGPGESFAVISPSVNLSTPGLYGTTAIADYTGIVLEMNELNNANTAVFSVLVPAAADLVVESLTLVPPYPTTADSIEFTAVVRNQGTGDAAASVMQMWVGGETEGTSHSIPALAAGDSYEVKRTASLSANAYRTTARADNTSLVPESNEGNNQNFVDFTVISADLVAHKLVYSSDETGNGEIFVIALDSNLDVLFKYNVTNRTSGEGYPRWSPTGDRIAFQSDYDGTGQTWVMNADGSNKRRVTNESLPVAPISWSTDGLSIYALMASPGDGEVVQVNVETGAVTVMTDVAGYNTQHWDLNSDQTKIAYVRGVEGNGFSNQLYVADFAVSGSDFTNTVLLPDAVPAPHSPRFSPSGTRIAVHLDRISPLGEGIGIIGTDGSNFLTPIPVEGFVNQTPEWIDENRIIYAHGTNPSANLYVLNLNDMSQKQITDANGYQGFPDVFTTAVKPPYKRKVDFNNDGQEDILWRYYGGGAYQGLNLVWFMNKTGSLSPMTLTASQNESLVTSMLTGPSSGKTSTIPQKAIKSILSGGKALASGAKLTMRDPLEVGRRFSPERRERVKGKDAQNVPTMNDAVAPRSLGSGTTKLAAIGLNQEVILSQVPDTAWQIAGTGDFDGDGDMDILWRYYGTGDYQGLNDIWFMNGTLFDGENVFSQVQDTNWRIAGTGDFDGDGDVDILWRYYGTGDYQGLNVVWYMNGATFAGETVFSAVTDTAWKIAGTGDFDGDGDTDILWRYYGTGAYQGLNVVWYMNGTSVDGETVFSQVTDTAWEIVGTGDFDGNGDVDILWRYYGTGAYQGLNVVWYMAGTTLLSEEVFSVVPDTSWRIVNR